MGSRNKAWAWRVLVCCMVVCCLPTQTAQAQADNLEARRQVELGFTAYESGDYKTALAHFLQSYDASSHPALLTNIAQCHEKLQQIEQAITYYERYLDAVPRAQNRRVVKRQIQKLQRVGVEAEEAARAAFEMEDYYEALVQFSDAYRATGRGELLYDVAQCYEQLGDKTKAAQTYTRYLEESPEGAFRDQAETRLDALPQIEQEQEQGPSAAPWVVMGSGVALAAAGGAVMFLSKNQFAEARDVVPDDGTMYVDVQRNIDQGGVKWVVGASLVGVGAALFATGVTMRVFDRKNADDEQPAEVRVGFGSVSIERSF